MNQLSYITDVEFRDSDLFTSTAQDWQADFVQLDRGAFASKIRQIGSDGTQVGECSLNRKMQQAGLAPPGGRTFIIQKHPFGELLWRRHRAGANHLLCSPANADFESVSPSGFHIYGVTVPWETIERVAATLEIPINASLFLGRDCVELTTAAMSHLRQQIGILLEWISPLQEGRPEALRAYRIKRDQVIGDLVGLWLNGASRHPPVMARGRDRVIKSALDYIAAHEREPLTVSAICAATGASERTIQYAFKEHLQTTPKQYLLARRLNGVRNELRASDRGHVRDLSAVWGFTHQGQFAAAYRQTFGESPSVTLRRSG